MRSARTATREEPLLAAAGERLHSTEDPAQSKINKERLKKKKKKVSAFPQENIVILHNSWRRLQVPWELSQVFLK